MSAPTVAIAWPNAEVRRGQLVRALAILALCLFAAIAASALRPEREIATFGDTKLDIAVPKGFGEWRLDPYTQPVIPDPSTLTAMERIYSETLARTYVNSSGQRVMLSLAYGRHQNDTMRLHQPEGCYTGQGFGVRQLGRGQIQAADRSIEVTRLHATMGGREEPVTYWMVIGGEHAVTQSQAKVAQLHFGLRGFVPDGLLFRVSSITADSRAGFELQDRFVRDLLAAVSPATRDGLTGK